MSGLISISEFEDRRARAAQAAARNGLDGILVCSRGGGTLDRYADLFWLCGFYTQFPYIPDVSGNWSGRAHGIMLLKPDGDARLVVDVPAWENVALADSAMVFADHVTEATIDLLKLNGLQSARLGFVGADTMPSSMYRTIVTALPHLDLVDFQSAFNDLKSVKSPAEIELLRRASQLGSRAIDAMMGAGKAGLTHGDIMLKGLDILVPARAILYNAFIRSGSGGPNPHFVKSALPTWGSSEQLQDGQFLCAGISGVLDGYYFDLARCRAIGRSSNAQTDVFESTIAVVEAGIAAVAPGVSGEEVMRAGSKRQSELGFEQTGSFQGHGHGIGLGWDDPWLAPGVHKLLQRDMVICVEKWLMRDGYAGDYEDTIVVTEAGADTITDARQRWW